MSNQQTLQDLLAERVAIFASSGKAQEIIDAGVEKMFKDIINDAFSNYGDFGKTVKETVKAALPSNVSDMFELTRYNALIANAMREQWASSGIEGDMLRRAHEAMAAALKDDVIPSHVWLRELLALFVEENKDEAAQEHWETPEIRIRDSEYGGKQIFFDKEPESSRRGVYSSKERSEWALDQRICVGFDARNPEKDNNGNLIGEVYSAQLGGNPIGRDFAIHTRWERLVAALYFGAAKLVIDCEEDEFSYDLYS